MALHWAFNPLGIGGYQPYSGTRGVFLLKSGAVISSAMVMTGGTVGEGYTGNKMEVYEHGTAANYTFMYSSTSVEFSIYSGGSAIGCTLSCYLAQARSGAVMYDTVLARNGINLDVFHDAKVYNTTVLGGNLVLGNGPTGSKGGSAFNTVVRGAGAIYDRSGGYTENTTVSGGLLRVSQGGVAYNTTLLIAGRASVWEGGLLSSATVSSGASIAVSGGSADIVDLNGGTAYIYDSGTLTNLQASNGAQVKVSATEAHLSGGTAIGPSVSGTQTTINVHTGALVEDLHLYGVNSSAYSWAQLVIYSGGTASNVVAEGSTYTHGTIMVSSGGLAIDCITNAYAFNVYGGGSAVRPVVQSGGQLYVFGDVTDYRGYAGVVSAREGCHISGGTQFGGNIQVYGTASGVLVVSTGALYVYNGNSMLPTTVIGMASDISTSDGGAIVIYGGTINGLTLNPSTIRTASCLVSSSTRPEGRSGYVTDIDVYGSTLRNWVYIYDSGHVSGARFYNSGCCVVNSGGVLEDASAFHEDPGYAIVISSGGILSGFHRIGARTNIPAVLYITPSANAYDVHNSGGGTPYTILLQGGTMDGYHASTVMNSTAVERSYMYVNYGGKLYNVIATDAGTTTAGNVIVLNNQDTVCSGVTATAGILSCNISSGAVLDTANGATRLVVNSGASAVNISGPFVLTVMNGGYASNAACTVDETGSKLQTKISAGGVLHNYTQQASGYNKISINIYGTGTQISNYGGAGGGSGVTCQVEATGYVSGFTAGPFSGDPPFDRVYGTLTDWHQSGGWLYVNHTTITTPGLLSGGTITTHPDVGQAQIRVYRSGVLSEGSAISTESTAKYCQTWISSGGLSKDTFQVGGYWYVMPNGVTSNHILSGGGRLSATGFPTRPAYFIVSSGGSAYSISAIASGKDSDNQANRCWTYASAGGYISGLYTSGGGSSIVMPGGSADAVVNYAQCNIYGSASDVTNHSVMYIGGTGQPGYATSVQAYNGTISIGTPGTVPASGAGSASDVTVYGGTVVVYHSGHVSSALVTRTSNAIGNLIAISAGTAFYVTAVSSGKAYAREAGVIYNITVSTNGQCHISSGGIVSTAIIASGGSCIVSSGGQLYDVTVASSGTLQILEGADTVSGITVLPAAPTTFVSLYAAHKTNLYGIITVSGAQVHLACTVEDIYGCSNAQIVASDGCNIMGGTFTDAYTTLHVSSGAAATAVLTKDNGRLYVSDGGYADSSVASSAGRIVVFSGGTAANISAYSNRVSGATMLHVNSGGYAENVSMYGGGGGMNGLSIERGGMVSGLYTSNWSGTNPYTIATGTIIDFDYNYGWLYMRGPGIASSGKFKGTGSGSSGSLWKDVKFYGATTVVIGSGGVVSSCSMTTGTFYLRGGTATDFVVSSAGNLQVSSGGSANKPVLSVKPCSAFVYDGGIINSATINGGILYMYTGAVASDTVVNGPATYDSTSYQLRVSGGVAYDTTVNSNGQLYVYSGGEASNTTVNPGGSFTVSSGGLVVGTVVSSGQGAIGVYGNAMDLQMFNARVWVYSGASVTDLYVASGGSCTVSAGTIGAVSVDSSVLYCCLAGSGADIMVYNNGIMKVWGGYQVSNVTVSGTASGSSLLYVSSASYVSGMTIESKAIAIVSHGAVVSGAVCNYGGSAVVSSGGVAYDTTINSGGTLIVNVYGYASGGVASNASAIAWATPPDATAQVYGTLEGLTLAGPGTRVNIRAATGLVSACTATSNSYILADKGGLASNCTFNNAYLVLTSNAVGRGCSASNGGSLDARTSTHLESCTVMSNAFIMVRDHSVASSNTIGQGASAFINADGMAQYTIVSGGRLHVSSGGTASVTTLSSGGVLHVSSGGSASGIVTLSGGTTWAWGGGTITDFSTSDGGKYGISGTGTVASIGGNSGRIWLYNNGYLSGAVVYAGAQIITYGGTAYDITVSSGGQLTALATNTPVVYDILILNSGVAYASQGAVLSRTIISSGGRIGLFSAGSADIVTVRAGAYISVNNGGVITNAETLPNSGTIYRGQVLVVAGGRASAINNHGDLFLYSNAVGSNVFATTSNHTNPSLVAVQGGTLTYYHPEQSVNLRVGYNGSGGVCSSATLLGAPTIQQYIYVSNGASIYDVDIASAAPLSKGIMIESAGAAYNISVSSGAYCYVSAGGTAEQVTATGGTVTVFSEGMLTNIEIVSNGLLTANDGAEVSDIVASDAEDLTKTSIQLSPFAMAYGTIIVNHARAHLAGTIETLSALDSAIVVASSGCNMMSAYIEGYDTELHVQGGAVVDTLGMEQGQAYISSGGVISATDAQQVIGTATISSGGYLHIGEFAYFEYFVCLSGGTVYVDPSAEYDDYESEPGAVIIWGD